MKTAIVWSIIFIASAYSLAAQEPPSYLFPDSLISTETGLNNINIIKKLGILQTLEYEYDESGKDSFLVQSFLYDGAGSLIKSLLYIQSVGLAFEDDFTYNAQNKLIARQIKNKNSSSIKQYRYARDSLEIMLCNFNRYSNSTDTSYVIQKFNSYHQLTSYTSKWPERDGSYKNSFVYQYDYSPRNHLISQKTYGGTNSGQPKIKEIYNWDFSTGLKNVKVEKVDASGESFYKSCEYNISNQCISSREVSMKNIEIYNQYSYYADGTIKQQIRKLSTGKTFVTKYFYQFN